MRREGYELAVSRPAVIEREVDGEVHEPWEQLTLDFAEQYQGAVMTRIAERKGELLSMMPDGRGRVRLEYEFPARGLIGFRTEYLTAAPRAPACCTTSSTATRRARTARSASASTARWCRSSQGKAVAYALVQSAGARLRSSSVTASKSTRAWSSAFTAATTTSWSTRRRASSSRTSAPPAPTRRSFSRRRSTSRSSRRSSSSTTTSSSRSRPGVRLRKKLLPENERKRESRKAADG